MQLVGKEVKPGKRIVTVYDYDKHEESDVILSSRRLDQIGKFLTEHPQLLDFASAPSIEGRRATAQDANEAYAFLVGQLTYTEAYVPQKLYTPMQYRELVPVSTEAGEWADTIRYEKMDKVGQAEWISDKGDDIPLVDVEYDEATRQVGHAGVGYKYTLQELRQTAYLRRPLSQRKMVVANEAYERFVNNVAILGSSTKNMLGFLNQTSVLQSIMTDLGGTGAWDNPATTADQILVDFNLCLNYVYTQMAYDAVVTDVRIPAAAWSRIVSTPRSSQSDTTILKFLRENNISKATQNVELNIGPCFGAETAGAATTGGTPGGSNSRAVFYVKLPTMLRFHIPMPLRFQAPQLRDLAVRVPGEFRLGGLEVTYTNSMLYADKVLTAG